MPYTKADKKRIRAESDHNVKVLRSMPEPGYSITTPTAMLEALIKTAKSIVNDPNWEGIAFQEKICRMERVLDAIDKVANPKVMHTHTWKKCKILVKGQERPKDLLPPKRRSSFTQIFLEYWDERCTSCPAVRRPWFGYGNGRMRYGSVKNP